MNKRLFHRNFTLLVFGQAISLFGNTILRFALSLVVLDVTSSATIFGTVTALAIIPTIIISPFGGMIADRANRRNIMVTLDFLTSILVLGFGFVVTDTNTVILISVVLVMLSIIQAFYQPAVQSSVPMLQTDENIMKANSIVNQVSMLASLIGPVIGGFLYGFFGVSSIVYISGICFFLSALLELSLHIPFEKQKSEQRMILTIKKDFQESISFVSREQPSILKTMLVIAALNLFLVPLISVGTPYMLRTMLGISSGLYGVAEGLMASAGILGAIITAIVPHKFKIKSLNNLLIVIGLFTLPIALPFMFQLSTLVSYGIITFCLMALQMACTVFSIVTISAIQIKTPKQILGKVTAYVLTFTQCAQPVGQAVYGVLYDTFTRNIALVIVPTAVIIISIGFCARFVFRHLA